MLARARQDAIASAAASSQLIDKAIKTATAAELKAEDRRVKERQALIARSARRIEAYKEAIRRCERQQQADLRDIDRRFDDERESSANNIRAAEEATARASGFIEDIRTAQADSDKPDETSES